jgi:predicted amidohydrolase
VKITVCELNTSGEALEQEWTNLMVHALSQASDLVLLPEMPFSPWLAQATSFRGASWQAAIDAHNRWEARFPEFAFTRLAGTRPVDFGDSHNNAAFLWDALHGLRTIHAKSHLENRHGSRKPVWYVSSPAEFTPVTIGGAVAAFLIGAELLETAAIEEYSRDGVTLLLTPRSTPASELQHWLDTAQIAARHGHVFSASSNRAPAGGGWIIDPDGAIIAFTDKSRPFVTVDVEFPGAPEIARRRREQQPHPAHARVQIPGVNPANP